MGPYLTHTPKERVKLFFSIFILFPEPEIKYFKKNKLYFHTVEFGRLV